MIPIKRQPDDDDDELDPLLAEHVLCEGIIDMVFRDQHGTWQVIDFKSDVGADLPAGYYAQVSLYVAAVEAATGEPAEGILLRV